MSDAPAQNDARAERRERLLASYAVAPPRRGRDGRFLAFLAACVLLRFSHTRHTVVSTARECAWWSNR